MNVFVLSPDRTPLTSCRPARARKLMHEGKAAVFRRYPFTLIMKEENPKAIVKPVTVKVDPGSKVTGIALIQDGRVIFAAELQHRGLAIKAKLQKRSVLRRGRRNRTTRYRAARFLNRTRPQGWLPPSLQHRIDTTMTWIRRFQRLVAVDGLALERVKFDTQKMQDVEISGVEYQHGELAGYEVREYLLEKWGRKCAYCGVQHVPLHVEHILAKANNGSNRISNLTLACEICNAAKGTNDISVFLKNRPARLARILAQAKAPLHDMAAVNATRNAMLAQFVKTGKPVEVGSGAMTKFNRTKLHYPKAHWIDAACVGYSGATVTLIPGMKPLLIKATGHGERQQCNTNRHGFPISHAQRAKKYAGFQTGDHVAALIPKGKFSGRHMGRIGIRHRPCFQLNGFDVHPKYLKRIQRADGYAYAFNNAQVVKRSFSRSIT